MKNDSERFDSAAYGRYDAFLTELARKTPLQIVPDDLFVGSVPQNAAAQGHFTGNFEKLLRVGLNQYMAELSDMAAKLHRDEPQNEAGYRFLESLAGVYRSIGILQKRYRRALSQRQKETVVKKDADAYGKMLYYLKGVPLKKATSFRGALQSLWFTVSFIRLCGYVPEIEDLDTLLEPYRQADLASGKLTVKEAADLFSCFSRKMCESMNGNGNQPKNDTPVPPSVVAFFTDGFSFTRGTELHKN